MKALLCIALLAASPAVAQPAPAGRTIVTDRAALARLRGNSGVTLQWISFESPRRGHVTVTERGGLVHLRGRQAANGGELTLDGVVTAIGARSFTFRGTISIVGAPDATRNCLRDGSYEFRATGARRYWRLQQMEECDGLTDYVDIYY